jgi:hypothetical protein
MWQETEFIHQNVLLCDLAILFISQRIQRPHQANHWPLLEYINYSDTV